MAKCSDLSKSDGPLVFRYPDLGFGFSHSIKNLEFEPITRASSTKLLNESACTQALFHDFSTCGPLEIVLLFAKEGRMQQSSTLNPPKQ